MIKKMKINRKQIRRYYLIQKVGMYTINITERMYTKTKYKIHKRLKLNRKI